MYCILYYSNLISVSLPRGNHYPLSHVCGHLCVEIENFVLGPSSTLIKQLKRLVPREKEREREREREREKGGGGGGGELASSSADMTWCCKLKCL